MILKDSAQEGSGLRAAGPDWVRLGAAEPPLGVYFYTHHTTPYHTIPDNTFLAVFFIFTALIFVMKHN